MCMDGKKCVKFNFTQWKLQERPFKILHWEAVALLAAVQNASAFGEKMKRGVVFVAFTLSPLLLLQRTLHIQTKATAAQTQNLKTLPAQSADKTEPVGHRVRTTEKTLTNYIFIFIFDQI